MRNIKLKRSLMAVCATFLGYGLALAEDKNPPARYWMDIATSNMTIPGMPQDTAMGGGLMGGLLGRMQGPAAGGPQRTLNLYLFSPQKLPADPQASHDIPPGQKMGDTLPLVLPRVERGPKEEAAPGSMEKPKARMLIYWGCSETVPAGQPKILDTEKMSLEAFGKAMTGRTPPDQGMQRFGAKTAVWPNEKDHKEVPRDGSLQGDHFIHGNYSPDIRFALGKQQDFMDPVVLSSQGGTVDSIKFEWRSIPASIGYFAMAQAKNEKTGETIFWSSSEVQEMGWGLMDYLPGSYARRLIGEKVIMSPRTTQCAIPKGIFKDTEGAMLQFIAYGEELNLAHPPKPKDAPPSWNPIWTAKVRVKSTGMLMLAETQGTDSIRSGEKPDSEQKPEQPAEQSPLDPVKKLKGLFGF